MIPLSSDEDEEEDVEELEKAPSKIPSMARLSNRSRASVSAEVYGLYNKKEVKFIC